MKFSNNSTNSKIIEGHRAFGVTYRNVGYFYKKSDKLNVFQVIIIERNDITRGDFDIEFNYEKILWETGSDSSGGANGYGGISARVGLANGLGNFLEYKGSGETLALLDTHPQTGDANEENGLIYQVFNSQCPGRITIQFRNGFPTNALQVNAGNDRTLSINDGASFQLYGSIQPSPVGVSSILWEKISGPGEVEFSNATSLSPTVIIGEPGNYRFRFTASRTGAFFVSDSDEVLIEHPVTFEVNGGFYSAADASSPLTVPLNQALVDYSGSNTVSLEWIQISGDAAVISDTHILNPVVTLPGGGYYSFQLKATTNHGSPFIKYADAEIYYVE